MGNQQEYSISLERETTLIKEKTIIWLAGLLSTDGSVRRRKDYANYSVATVEKDWADVMVNRLSEIGISSHITPPNGKRACYVITLHNPYKITLFLKKYALDFLSPRKRKLVQTAYPYRPRYVENWTSKEDIFIKQNAILMSDIQMANHLGRTVKAVEGRRLRLGLNKMAQSKWTIDETQLLLESYLSKTLVQIAKILGRSEASIRGKMKALKLSKIKKWTEKELGYLLVNCTVKSDSQIAKDLNVTRSKVKNKRQKLGLWKGERFEIEKNIPEVWRLKKL